jgi:hypothetical protein
MPFQGIAETVTVLLCHSEMGDHSAQSESHHYASAAAHDHKHAAMTSLDATVDDHSGDACCHVAVSGLPLSGTAFTLPDFAVLASARGPHQSSTFLELPQRPPLV